MNCLYVDEEGRLWVGTNDDGVTILINEHVMNVLDEENGLLSNSVKALSAILTAIIISERRRDFRRYL